MRADRSFDHLGFERSVEARYPSACDDPRIGKDGSTMYARLSPENRWIDRARRGAGLAAMRG